LDRFLSRSLTSYTDKTITSPDVLRKQLEVIRRRGYAVDDEEMEAGVCAVSAPICDRQGAVIAAISVPSPISRMTQERIPEIAEALKEAARAISQRLGCDR
jgi:DNA-binding IclR family transcriptional regulator